jgi:antitoxin component YwqK of YwqJK toxin-antitoxin module
MYERRLFLIFSLLCLASLTFSQNVTDARGLKQGPWVKKYPNGNLMYEGTFKDDSPVGLFKRYNEEGILLSELNYSDKKDEVRATFLYPDGTKAAEGTYVARKKEGLWRFYSATQPSYLIGEENYNGDIRNGLSQKYYADSTIAEKVTWDNGNRTGEWLQYYPDGSICLRAEYIAGKLEGLFSYYHPNGKLYYEGNYKDDFRTGDWMVFNYDGSLKQIIAYEEGKPSDPKLADQETKFLDQLEENRDKIEIVDITGATIK